MALKSELMASGVSGAEASRLGLDPLANITATGSNQATAAPMVSNCSNINAGTGGVIISQSHAMHCIANNSGSTISLYPPVGGTINGGTLNAAFTGTFATGKSVMVFSAGLNFIVNLSA